MKQLKLIYGDIFEQYLLKNRKDLFKSKAIYMKKREVIHSSSPKKYNRKLGITYLDIKHLIELIIGHLHDVKIDCASKDKPILKKEIFEYIKNYTVFI